MAARLYGLFRREVEGERVKYVREFPAMAYPKAQAVRVFQNALLAPYFVGGPIRELRPVKPAA
jgi:hypothetical protein